MKRLVKNYFSEDIVSAILALVIFVLTVTMIVWHIIHGIKGISLFLELMLGIAAWGLVWAVYKENKNDAAKCYDK